MEVFLLLILPFHICKSCILNCDMPHMFVALCESVVKLTMMSGHNYFPVSSVSHVIIYCKIFSILK